MGRPRRSGNRCRDHAQPAGLHGRARHCARSGRGRAWARCVRCTTCIAWTALAPIAGRWSCTRHCAPTIQKAALPFTRRLSRASPTAPRPQWMRDKLHAIGQKPISVLVDITNFISIDLGRPLHVYDRAKLNGPLVARKATDGEEVLALNGKTYTLDSSMTVIADDGMVHDIGGSHGRRAFGRVRKHHRCSDRMRLFHPRTYRPYRAEAYPDQRCPSAV